MQGVRSQAVSYLPTARVRNEIADTDGEGSGGRVGEEGTGKRERGTASQTNRPRGGCEGTQYIVVEAF